MLRGSLTSRIMGVLVTAAGRLTQRHAVLLSSDAGREEESLDASGPYRADGALLSVALGERNPGRLRAELFGGPRNDRDVPLAALDVAYFGPCVLAIHWNEGAIRLDDRPAAAISDRLPSGRFAWRLEWSHEGQRKVRRTSHYRPVFNDAVESEAALAGPSGDDTHLQRFDEPAVVVDLLRAQQAVSPLLEVCCGSGALLPAFEQAGFVAYGSDDSPWAVEQAKACFQPDRVLLWDVEGDLAPPTALAERGPYQTILLWFVLEHFKDPFLVLERLEGVAAPGCRLVLGAMNADALTHILFGREREDAGGATRRGARKVGVRLLREHLSRRGWRVDWLVTRRVQDVNLDPAQATLHEWWAADARFRQLLVERELGDVLQCVAVKL